MAERAEKFIDVERIIASKSPRAARMLPAFVLNFLKKTIHEDECNAFMEKYGHLRDHDFNAAVVRFFGPKLVVSGLENIPKTGGCCIVANHPLGGLDGVALMHVVKDARPDQKFPVNDLLLLLERFGSIFVGVNKHGGQSRDSIRAMDEVFSGGNCVMLFPAGLVSRKQPDGSVRDLEWKKGGIFKAVQNGLPIVPCHISGRNSEFFLNLSIWRKRLGVKFNLEMLWLVDEMFRQKGKTIEFCFGEPIASGFFGTSKSQVEWAEWLKQKVYSLKPNA